MQRRSRCYQSVFHESRARHAKPDAQSPAEGGRCEADRGGKPRPLPWFRTDGRADRCAEHTPPIALNSAFSKPLIFTQSAPL